MHTLKESIKSQLEYFNSSQWLAIQELVATIPLEFQEMAIYKLFPNRLLTSTWNKQALENELQLRIEENDYIDFLNYLDGYLVEGGDVFIMEGVKEILREWAKYNKRNIQEVAEFDLAEFTIKPRLKRENKTLSGVV